MTTLNKQERITITSDRPRQAGWVLCECVSAPVAAHRVLRDETTTRCHPILTAAPWGGGPSCPPPGIPLVRRGRGRERFAFIPMDGSPVLTGAQGRAGGGAEGPCSGEEKGSGGRAGGGGAAGGEGGQCVWAIRR